MSGATHPDTALLRVAVLSTQECSRAVDTGDVSGIEFLEPALRLAGEFVDYRDKVASYHDVVLRYVSRMGYRATPFGLFAGVAPIRVARQRRLELAPRADHRVRVRVDAGALESVVDEAARAHAETVPNVVNPTVRRVAGRLRYSQPGNANAPIVELRETHAIAAVLRICTAAPTSAEAIARRLAADPTRHELLRQFVLTLAEKQLLLSDTALLFHGEEPADLAIGSLTAMGATADAAALTDLVGYAARDRRLADVGSFDFDGPWSRAATVLPALDGVPVRHRFHVDLEMSAPEATLDRGCASALQLATEKLVELFPPDDALDSFTEAFRLRYEDTRAPLLDALDPDRGVLPPGKRRASHLAGAAEYLRGQPSGGRTELYQATIQALALGRDARPVDLLDTPSAQHRPTALRHPVRVVHGVLLDQFEGRYDAQLLAGYRHGSLGALSRFALTLPELVALGDGGGDDGGDPDGPIVAELMFGPDGRYGNIAVRPRIHRHAIALHGARTGTITPDELDVSVTPGNDVLLWHRPTGHQVLLDLNTAHNILAYHNSPIYTFLARLRDWGTAMWDWGPLGRVPRLPRVSCGSVVLVPQRWMVGRAEIAAVLADPHPARRLRRAVPDLGERRWLGFGRDDNILAVDTFSDRSVAALLCRATSKAATAFAEMPQIEAAPVRSDRGRHCAEVMLPIRVRHERSRPRVAPPVFDPAAGRDWVYVRYHCGLATVGDVLTATADLVDGLRAEQPGLRWFFVRYHDGVDHLRVRVAPSGPRARAAVLGALEALGHRLADAGLVSRTVLDTYVPEPGRYGGYPALAAAESLFSADSDEVVTYLRAGPSEIDRLDRAVTDALAFTGHVTVDLDQQLGLLTTWRGAMGIGPTKRTGRVARERGVGVEDLPAVSPELARCLDGYLRELSPLDERARWYALGSAMHMHFNRLFDTDARRLEWLAYDFACRALRGYRARAGQARAEAGVRGG